MFDVAKLLRWRRPGRGGGAGLVPPVLGAAILPVLALRFAGHLPYFKIGSGLMLPQGLSFMGAAVTALAYSLLCLGVTRWLSWRQAVSLVHRPAAASLLGTMAVIAAMMTLGPLIGLMFPAAPPVSAEPDTSHAERWHGLLPAYLGLMVPICIGFFAAQLVSRRTERKRGSERPMS